MNAERRQRQRRTLRPAFTRSEVCHLLDGLESIIEDLKYDGGLCLAEPYIDLRERVRIYLMRHEERPT